MQLEDGTTAKFKGGFISSLLSTALDESCRTCVFDVRIYNYKFFDWLLF